jgi:drug/metabolite transporter (DMT)-like permease
MHKMKNCPVPRGAGALRVPAALPDTRGTDAPENDRKACRYRRSLVRADNGARPPEQHNGACPGSRPRSKSVPVVGVTVVASLLFATMGVCIKFASLYYGSGEIVMYRGVVGALAMAAISRWRGESLRTRVPWKHASRSVTGVAALTLWFQSIAVLPLATAVTMNYTSSLWLAAILTGSTLWMSGQRVAPRLLWTVVIGFVGVVLVLRPTIESQALWYGVLGLASGLLSALSYLQVAALGRAGEPDTRIVFYFSVAGVLGGAALSAAGRWHALAWPGLGWLLAVGVLSTVAQLLLTRAYALGPALVTASLQYLGIAFSFLYGVALFGDAIGWHGLLGIILIVAAGIVATRMRHAPSSSRDAPRRD